MRTRIKLVAAVATVAMTAIACGGEEPATNPPADGSPQPTKLTLVTEWCCPDPLWVPFVVGVQEGVFADAGLDVKIQAPPDNSTTLKMLASGQGQIGLSAITDLVFAKKQGLPLVSIANYSTTNNWGLFQLGDKPIDIASLRGKKIGIYNDSWTAAMLPLMLKSANLTMNDVQTVAATASVIPLLLNGKIDVATEVTNLGGVEIDTSGQTKTELLAPQVGAPDTPIWIYVTNADWAQQNSGTVTAFLGAIQQAAQWSIDNPEQAVADYEQAYPDTASSHDYNMAAWKATIPLLTRDDAWFTQTDQQWTEFTGALVDSGQLPQALPPSDYYTNAYLPASG
jgi:putative hydroxymethylpyrimidine transport system substrate-binding protein